MNKPLRIDPLEDDLFREQFQSFAKLMAYYRCAMMEIETKFNVLNQEFSLRFDRNPISSIKTRLKSPASIREKLRFAEYPKAFEGFPIALVTAGLLALAFMGFSGMKIW